MPIYMDRHDVSSDVTAETVAQLHQEDLKIQHKFNCRGLTYWFDDRRKTAFCLIEAPDKQCLVDMHNHAHGDVPHRIIEVDSHIVESFLGRIEDPEKSQNTKLNIINDPAFRTIMATGLRQFSFAGVKQKRVKSSLRDFNRSTIETIKRFNGRLVKQTGDYFLVSFESVSPAIKCALQVQSDFNAWKESNGYDNVNLKTGLSAGVPVTDRESIFEETVRQAERLYYISRARIMVTGEVKELYQSENLNAFIAGDQVRPLTPDDERFLNLLMDYTEKSWKNNDLQVERLGKELGYSKSQLYRKTMALTGKSPNTFIKQFRLNQAVKLINTRKGNVSEIAFETGFGSPSYFTKCFQKEFGVKPTDYIHMQEI